MTPFSCPHCQASIFKSSGDGAKIKARTSVIVIHKSGGVEINCQSCRQGVILPLAMAAKWELQKAVSRRLTLPTKPRHAKDRG